MTDDPTKPVQAPEQPAPRRFNPFAHEEDMFKVVLWAGGVFLAIILLAVIARAIF